MALSPEQQAAQMQEQLARVLGNSSGYTGTFREAYNRLGQDVRNTPNVNPAIVQAGAQQLGSEFINQYTAKNGTPPPNDMVKEFVGSHLDIPTAQGVIQGTYNQANAADDARKYIATLPNQGGASDAQRAIDAQNKYIDEQTAGLTDQATRDINTQADQLRGRTIDEMGATAMQPNARVSLDLQDTQRSKNLSDAIRGLATNAAGLKSGAVQFGTNVGLTQQQMAQNQNNLSDQIRMLKENQSYGRGQDIQEQALARQLGQAQADASKPGTLDYLNTAFQGLGALGGLAGGVGNLIKGWKTPSGGGGGTGTGVAVK